jgi:hypothetical protein
MQFFTLIPNMWHCCSINTPKDAKLHALSQYIICILLTYLCNQYMLKKWIFF